jgi:hypothetical protein
MCLMGAIDDATSEVLWGRTLYFKGEKIAQSHMDATHDAGRWPTQHCGRRTTPGQADSKKRTESLSS